MWDKVAQNPSKDDVKPEAVYEDLNVAEIDPDQEFEINCETPSFTVTSCVSQLISKSLVGSISAMFRSS